MNAGCTHNDGLGSTWRINGVGSLGDAGKCECPNRFTCWLCGESVYGECYSGRAERCGYCSELKRGDIKALVRHGCDRPCDALYFGTLTAPGTVPTTNGYVIRWDRAACRARHGDDVTCSGSIGCVSLRSDLAQWHRGLRKRWSYFRQFMRRELAALAGVDIDQVDVQCMGAWELQKRGALHRHFMMRVSGPVTHAMVCKAFAAYRAAHDFGKQSDLDVVDTSSPREAARRAGYIAKYICKGYDDLSDVPCGFDLRQTTHYPGASPLVLARFRPWSASLLWGATLGLMRARRLLWAVGAGNAPAQTGTAALASAASLDPYNDSSTTSGVVAPSVGGSVAM